MHTLTELFFLILACLTYNGEVSDKPCIFPWFYPSNGANYAGCAYPHNDLIGDWCPTEVNEAGEYVAKSGNWGYCNDICRRDSGKFNGPEQLRN